MKITDSNGNIIKAHAQFPYKGFSIECSAMSLSGAPEIVSHYQLGRGEKAHTTDSIHSMIEWIDDHWANMLKKVVA